MATATATTPLTDALNFVLSAATDEECDRLLDALRTRRKTLGAMRAAAVTVGAKVKTDNLSPKYLCGLTGVVESIKGQRCDIRLDAASTTMLRWKGGRRFFIPADVTEYVLTGVPTQCAIPQE